jgi:hypothetical protein
LKLREVFILALQNFYHRQLYRGGAEAQRKKFMGSPSHTTVEHFMM